MVISVSRRSVRLCVAATLTGMLSLSACSHSPEGMVQGALTGIGGQSAQGAVSAWSVSWSSQVKGASVSYSPDGAGAGLKAFSDGQAHFTASGSSVSDAEKAAISGLCTSAGALSIAAGVLPVGVAIKVDGINDLVLDAPTLAAILRGDVERWNDPKIAALNAEQPLPDVEIKVMAEEGPSETTRAVNTYLANSPGVSWNPLQPDRWPKDVKGLTGSQPRDLANKLDDTDGGLAVLDGGIIGNRFVATQLVFDGQARKMDAASVVNAVAAGQVTTTPRSVVQALDDRAGYGLATVIYVNVCQQYVEEPLNLLTRSFGEALLGEKAQKDANSYSFVMSPSKKAISEGLALVRTIGDAR
ncbi:substrate-binding domain-containing protein [Pseudarthrobacter raffinosi]|uniref:substrate-binding domain-containing protein n=2 Tax=Pseudarthrobacter raffinosi TaxID=2953651 RepID=UPI00208E0428|nr:substrate-binding domain-containing protein [Pseudarthrobacter sp. MDT3-9]